MRWPGLGDPRKRRKTIRFLIILLMVGVAVGVTSSVLQGYLSQNDPLKICINNRDTPHKITATLELHVDGNRADIPANIGFDNVEEDGLFGLVIGDVCQRTLYTITDDGVFYVEFGEEFVE